MIRLLTDIERKNLKEWSYRVSDESITTKLLNPFWEMVVKIIPEYVAPNVLSIAGLCMILFSYHLTYYHALRFPRLMALCSALLIFAYQTLDAIDGKHARNTKNSSPLGELFDHACDSIGTVFIILTVSHHLGVTDVNTLFYVTQSGLFVFLL
jgi:phosphatidylglycerophosphate synthase